MNKYLSSTDIVKKRDKLAKMVENSRGKSIHGRYVYRLMLVDREIGRRLNYSISFIRKLAA